ncbi:MAG: MoxR family ATPase, partial [Oscillospiraceae bacterium]|nr:MoxR family ATPase [Oscillospiraceae bacterium]
FMIRLSIGYPDPASEAQILKNKRSAAEISDIRPVITAAELLSIQKMTADVYADDRVYRYIADIAAATRSSSEIELGISTRGAIAISAMAKATAVLKGRDYVIPDDVDYILPSTAAHRLVLSSHSKNISDAEAALKNAVSSVRVPKL